MQPTDLVYYYKCNMTKMQHIIAYVISATICSVVFFLFYHIIPVSIILGLLIAVYVEQIYAQSTIDRRQAQLRTQFKDFLDSMAVAVRSGNVETQAVEFAYHDLQLTYSDEADIIVEIRYMLQQYEKGGVKLSALFTDLGVRSDLQDIKNFATVYEVIEGRSDRFGEILMSTRDIISNKIEIEQEIETTINSSKAETNTMMFMPIVIVVVLAILGGGMMDSLFETTQGHLVATASLAIFGVAFALAQRATRYSL